MFKPKAPARLPAHIDLETMRETLLYIESDCRDCDALKGVAAALEAAIDEIERLEATTGPKAVLESVAVQFLPAGL